MKKRLLTFLAAACSMMCLSGCSFSGDDITSVNPDKYITAMRDYKGVTLEAEVVPVTDEQVDKRIEDNLKSSVETVDVTDRALKNGDIANINYEGKVDGVAFEGGSNMGQAGYDLEIGSGMFIPGFEEALIGMQSGETRDIDVTFPEDYTAENLAGKDAVFTVILNGIKEKKVPELTDEYVAGLGIANVSTIDGLKVYIRQQLEDEAKKNYETQLDNSAMQKMIELCDFTDEVPQDRYKYYYDNVMNMDTQYASQFGVDLDTFVIGYYGFENKDAYIKYVEDSAIQAVKVDLASGSILKDAGIKITDKMVEEDIAANLDKYGVSTLDEFKEKYNIEEYKAYLVNRKAVELIKENANIIAPSASEDAAAE
ncbi:MAG: trigger factor [Lachnospiraceae bacterium]|nr:trigger factor [Lachnospiraceae bacterium]